MNLNINSKDSNLSGIPIPGPVEWEHTEKLEVQIDGKSVFIGRKGSSFREKKLDEIARSNRVVSPDN